MERLSQERLAVVVRVHRPAWPSGDITPARRRSPAQRSHAHSEWIGKVSERNGNPVERPKFGEVWGHHQALRLPLTGTGQHIGGEVQERIDNGLYKDGCALRMTAALNKSGVFIKAFLASHPRHWETARGGDGEKYMARTSELKSFLTERLGRPDKVVNDPRREDLKNFKGIAVFQWDPGKGQNATGHADLWDGKSFSHHGEEYLRTRHKDGKEYPEVQHTNVRVFLWSLPD